MHKVAASAAVNCFDLMTSVQPSWQTSQDVTEAIQQILALPRVHSFECYVEIPEGLEAVADQLLISFAVMWPCQRDGRRVDFQNDQRPAFLFLSSLRCLLSLQPDARLDFCVHFRRVVGWLLQQSLV